MTFAGGGGDAFVLPVWMQRKIARRWAEEPDMNGQVIINFQAGRPRTVDIRTISTEPDIDKPTR